MVFYEDTLVLGKYLRSMTFSLSGNSQVTWNWVSSVQSLSCVWLFVIPWTAALQASLLFTNSQSLLKFVSIELVMPSNHLILCVPFSSCFQSFLASVSFLMNWLFASGGQSIGASASVLPMSIQDWFPLEWTCWISLLSKGLLGIFSNTTTQKHQFFGIQSSLWSNSHIHTWLLEKTIALTIQTFAGKVISLLFLICNLGLS